MGQDPAPIGCLPRAIDVGAASAGFFADRGKSTLHIPPSERLSVLFVENLISAQGMLPSSRPIVDRVVQRAELPLLISETVCRRNRIRSYKAMFCVCTVCGLSGGNVPPPYLKGARAGHSGERWAYMGVASPALPALAHTWNLPRRGVGGVHPRFGVGTAWRGIGASGGWRCLPVFGRVRGQAPGRHVREFDGTGGTRSGWTPSIRHLLQISALGRRRMVLGGALRGRSPRTREGRIGPTAQNCSF